MAKLDNKFSSDWIAQYSPTDRIENMSKVIRVIEAAKTPADVLGDSCFTLDVDSFLRNADASVYGRRFTRYLLLKLDYLYQNHCNRISLESLSVEHILPQNPADDSQWKRDFTDAQRVAWADRLGNLVLITGKKNTSQGNSDYALKLKKYFASKIDTCPNSLRVLRNTHGTPKELEANHAEVLNKVKTHYGIPV